MIDPRLSQAVELLSDPRVSRALELIDMIAESQPAPAPVLDSPENLSAVKETTAKIILSATDALREVIRQADSWHDSARSNHEALGHRDRFAECCGSFVVTDIKNMVNDAARKMGLPEVWDGDA